MKKIKTNYSKKMIDSSKYSIINIKDSSTTNIKDSSTTEEEMKNKGCVFMPYVLREHTEESLKQYKDFMKTYSKQHKYCPKCGSTEHISTLVGYPLIWDKKEEYKNLNICKCTKCGDKHSRHDRISSIKLIIN